MKILYLTILHVFLVSCTLNEKKQDGNNQLENNSKMNTTKREQYIINNISVDGIDYVIREIEKSRSLIEGQGDEFYDLYYSSGEGINAAIILYPHWLQQQGYIYPSDSIFSQKIKLYFNIDTPYTYNIVDYDNFFTYMNPRDYPKDYSSFPVGSEWDTTYKNIFFSKRKHFLMILSEMGILARLMENGQYETFFSENILHYNKFIFNDNKQSLLWLIQNDLDFLELLVKEFGYDKNEKINKAVIKLAYKNFHLPEYSQDYTQIYDLFVKNNCQKELDIKEGLMKTIVEMTTKEENEYLEWLSSIGFVLASNIKGEDNKSVFDDFNKQEKLKILAYICYYVETAYIKNDITIAYQDHVWNKRSILSFELMSIPQLQQTLKENNYFDLPDYKDMIQKRLKEAEELGWG